MVTELKIFLTRSNLCDTAQNVSQHLLTFNHKIKVNAFKGKVVLNQHLNFVSRLPQQV